MSGDIHPAADAVKPVYRKTEARAPEATRPDRAFSDLLAEAERVQDAVDLSPEASPHHPAGWLAGGQGWLHGLGISPLRLGGGRRGREAAPPTAEERDR